MTSLQVIDEVVSIAGQLKTKTGSMNLLGPILIQFAIDIQRNKILDEQTQTLIQRNNLLAQQIQALKDLEPPIVEAINSINVTHS